MTVSPSGHITHVAISFVFALVVATCSGVFLNQVRAASKQSDRTEQKATKAVAPSSNLKVAPEKKHARVEIAKTTKAIKADGPAYEAQSFDLTYAHAHTGHPSLAKVKDLRIKLGRVSDGYTAPRKGIPKVVLTLKGPFELHKFYASAIRTICQQIVAYFNDMGFLGVYVAPDERDIDSENGEDLRQVRTTLHITVWTSIVTKIRTLASGQRIPDAERIDNPKHARIRRDSPVKPYDVLRKDLLDRYVFFLNRHPGRRVDVAVTRGNEASEVGLDYLITENKPWFVYTQLSNTGTDQTSKWRERFGFRNDQLTGRDDIFALDYITAGFDEAHAVVSSYEMPVITDRLRLRLDGLWSKYTASDVGLSQEQFDGKEWSTGFDLIANVFQHKQLFVDLSLGASWRHINVDNKAVRMEGEENFFLPRLGLRVERYTKTSNTDLWLNLETNIPGMADTDADEVVKLGRLDTDIRWTVLQWRFSHSFFLEPLLFPKAWKDTSTPKSSTLAHEIFLSFKGQCAFDHRLIPQAEQVAGGFYTVRGYEESVVAGDNALIGTIEYRYHIPRSFRPRKKPVKLFRRPFRFAPEQVYGVPDWDLILRPFFDIGYVENCHRLQTEENETLAGCGLGIELQIKRNFNIRCDYAYALRDLHGGLGEADDNRLHLVATLLW